ncbi:hypothetical protein BST95_05190 [Halioglobus japonicus]|nr:hypothetical protein BST95_05190 [Halioglobus japonicus]
MVEIPLIDFSSGSDEELAAQLAYAMGEVGFMTVTNIGIPTEIIDAIFRVSSQFFERDTDYKHQYLYRNVSENFGYQGVGMESLEPGKPGDLKETFTLRLAPGSDLGEDRWPSEAFRSTAQNFYNECLGAATRIMRLMARVFELPEDFFSATVGGENVALRLLFYPREQQVADGGEQLGAGAHTDYGILTLLFQSGVGGLEVRDGNGQWIPVPSIPGSVVINTGDLMHRWTNGHFRSTEHRVKPMTSTQDRYSVAFFVDPDSQTLIEVLPQCVDESEGVTYPPITAGEHIRQKLQRSHN